MAVLKVEIVVWAVQVRRHHGNVVGAILQVEAFAHFESSDFGNGIRLVGVFKRRCQQAVLTHGLRRLTGVDARGAEKEQFLHPVAIAFTYHILLYLQVLVDEVGSVLQVSHDTAYMCCGQYHGVRLFLVEELAYCHAVQQIQFGVCATYQVVKTACF